MSSRVEVKDSPSKDKMAPPSPRTPRSKKAPRIYSPVHQARKRTPTKLPNQSQTSPRLPSTSTSSVKAMTVPQPLVATPAKSTQAVRQSSPSRVSTPSKSTLKTNRKLSMDTTPQRTRVKRHILDTVESQLPAKSVFARERRIHQVQPKPKFIRNSKVNPRTKSKVIQ